MNQLFNHKGVCRTAAATPGLLTMYAERNILTNSGFFQDVIMEVGFVLPGLWGIKAVKGSRENLSYTSSWV